MSTRETMLARIRSAVAGGPPAPAVPREYARTGSRQPGSAEVIDLLVDRLTDYRANVRVIDDAVVEQAVSQALQSVSSVVIADDLERRIAAACAADGRTVHTDGAPTELTPTELDAVDAVVTTARVAIATTGTIVLDGGPGCGRRAITLVPDRHLVVLYAGQVVESVPDGIARLEATAPLTMISGPSATSDIELSRVEGVHGPRTLDVLIVG